MRLTLPAQMQPPSNPDAHGYTSPASTMPFPAPDSRFRPVGYWESERQTVAWVVGETQVLREGTWGTPLFDLRPDLHGVMSRESQAVAIQKTSGQQLYVSITGLTGDLRGLSVYRREFGHPVSSAAVHQYTPDVDVTADVLTGLPGAILAILPPADGFGIRYWALSLRFAWTGITAIGGTGLPTPMPKITVVAGMY